MILTELRHRLDLANKWVMEKTPADTDTYWTGPTKTTISIACRAAWGESVSIYASDVGHRDMDQFRYDPRRQRRQDRFVCIPEGNPDRAAHYGERTLSHSLGRYDVACLRYEQSGPPTLLLAAESEFNDREKVLEDFDKLCRSSAEFRVMVYNRDAIPICELAAHISRPGGTYLFAAFQNGGLIYEEFAP